MSEERNRRGVLFWVLAGLGVIGFLSWCAVALPPLIFAMSVRQG